MKFEKNVKKCLFLNEVVKGLKLENVEVINGRAEDLGKEEMPQYTLTDYIYEITFTMDDYVYLKLYNSNDTYISPSNEIMDAVAVLSHFPASNVCVSLFPTIDSKL